MEGFTLLGQGAEARLYTGTYLGKSALLKERFKKEYRHPVLDVRLTKERIRAEARAIVRAKAAGVATPALYLVDLDRRFIIMEYMENARTLKSLIDKNAVEEKHYPWVDRLAVALGQTLAKLHSKNIVHGDLTTSNILIRTRHPETDVHNDECTIDNIVAAMLVLIDFGLARVESTTEDKAVDLYVLERSLLSSHSQLPGLFPAILSNYVENVRDKRQQRELVSKYEEVRARGRKRLMIG